MYNRQVIFLLQIIQRNQKIWQDQNTLNVSKESWGKKIVEIKNKQEGQNRNQKKIKTISPQTPEMEFSR